MISFDIPEEGMEDSLISLWEEAFGDSRESVEVYMATAYSREHCRCAVENGELLSALHIMDCRVHGDTYAYIYAVATAKKHRGRGLFRRLMADTETYLGENGYRGAVLLPADGGLAAAYGRLGYSPMEGLSPVMVKGEAASDLVLRQLTADEYLKSREKYLPAGSVMPSGNMTAYLARYAELYATDGSAFACVPEDGKCTVAEYLGESEMMPAVLAALGYSEGEFYVRLGQLRAMYKTFGGKSPAFLGIAFNI